MMSAEAKIAHIPGSPEPPAVAAECLLVDIDGFSGRSAEGRPQVIIPREVGIVRLQMRGDAAVLVEAASLYYRGGVTKAFAQVNREGLTYQSRSIHGYPLGDDDHTRAIPAGSILLDLPPDPVDAALEGERTAGYRLAALAGDVDTSSGTGTPLFLVHKGGTEGTWLAPLAAAIARTRPGPVAVVDLNTLGCPKASDFLRDAATRARVEAACRCGMEVHPRLARRGQKWARHCPQAECIIFAEWIVAECRVAGDRLARDATLDTGGVDQLLARSLRAYPGPDSSVWAAATPGSSAHERCVNYLRAALQREKEYVPAHAVEGIVLRWAVATRQALGLNYL